MKRRLDYVIYIIVFYFNYRYILNECILYDFEGVLLFGYDVIDIICYLDNLEF